VGGFLKDPEDEQGAAADPHAILGPRALFRPEDIAALTANDLLPLEL
jgi:hypothetical protein